MFTFRFISFLLPLSIHILFLKQVYFGGKCDLKKPTRVYSPASPRLFLLWWVFLARRRGVQPRKRSRGRVRRSRAADDSHLPCQAFPLPACG